jgi:ATP diphosphatase
MGQEQALFDFDAVVHTLVQKLLRRHPHVFPQGTLESRVDPDDRPGDEWIAASWERIKAEERAAKGETEPQQSGSRLDDIPGSLPALARADKLQRRAARYGFDWPDIGPVFDKLEEELGELREAWQNAQQDPAEQDAVEDELGDLMFVCVNLARFLKVNPDQALRRTNRKFEARFQAIEVILQEQGRTMEGESLETLDEIWDSVKGVERSQVHSESGQQVGTNHK